MCNLYTLKAERWEIDAYFRATNDWRDQLDHTPLNYAAEVYPGYPGLVMVGDALQAMAWGFPLAQKSKKTGLPLKPKPVNNTRDDKLLTPFWKDSFTRRRCLIPLTHFAEAVGVPGRMTRTWISLPDRPIFCCPGIWRWSEEWGDVYSMVTCAPCEQTLDIHDRSPVILHERDHLRWLEGSPEEAQALCAPWEGPLTIEHTDVPWAARR